MYLARVTTASHLKSVFELTYYFRHPFSFERYLKFLSDNTKIRDTINDWTRKRHSLQSNTRLNIFTRNSIHHIIMIEFPVPRKLTDYEILISPPLLYTNQRFFQHKIFTINNRITAQFTNHQTEDIINIRWNNYLRDNHFFHLNPLHHPTHFGFASTWTPHTWSELISAGFMFVFRAVFSHS